MKNISKHRGFKLTEIRGKTATLSMGDLQDPIDWRCVSTIFLAIFCGDIPLHRPEK